MTSKQLRLVAIGLLVLAAVLALFAWHVARRAAQPRATASAVQPPAYPVVVTTRPLEAGKPIPADALEVATLPIDPAGAHRRTEPLVGQVPVVGVGAHVPLLDSHLNGGLAAQVPEGERAVAVAVDEVIGVGHRVRPGDFVDVFVVLRRDNQEIGDSQARLLLSRLRVLAYGTQAVDEAGAGAESSTGRRDGAKTAVLTVPLAQVGKLTMAQQAGRLVLALRNPNDAAAPTDAWSAEPGMAIAARGAMGEGVALSAADRAAAGIALRGLAGTPARAAAPPPLAPRPAMPVIAVAPPPRAGVEVIRAGKRELE